MLERKINEPSSPFYTKEIFPAGKREAGETYEQTLFREVKEEILEKTDLASTRALALALLTFIASQF